MLLCINLHACAYLHRFLCINEQLTEMTVGFVMHACAYLHRFLRMNRKNTIYSEYTHRSEWKRLAIPCGRAVSATKTHYDQNCSVCAFSQYSI